jgi:hypothetical protein
VQAAGSRLAPFAIAQSLTLWRDPPAPGETYGFGIATMVVTRGLSF